MAANYRLTIVQAGTGYGKTTAVAALQYEDVDLIWYGLDEEDGDPLIFLTHLVHGLAQKVPSLLQHTDLQLESWETGGGLDYARYIVDQISNELAQYLDQTLYFVFEDVHVLNNSSDSLYLLNQLIDRVPYHLRPVLITRSPPNLPYLLNWQMHEEVLEIQQKELAFTAEELCFHFRTAYDYTLSADQVEQIMARVEGWPITLPLIWQRLNQAQGNQTIAMMSALDQITGSTGQLFHYLTKEVLSQQQEQVRDFLQVTPVLRQMTADFCNHLRQVDDSAQILRQLDESNLFIVNLGDGVSRYHHLFRGLLYGHIPPDRVTELHRKAADLYRERNDLEEAFYHYIAADAQQDAAQIIHEIGRQLVRAGRLDTLQRLINQIDKEVRHLYPRLWVYLGHIARLHGQKEDALAHYDIAVMCAKEHLNRADLVYALRGKVRFYLDTVYPSKADEILEEILTLTETEKDTETRLRIAELMAENMINHGKIEAAEQYQAQADALRQGEEQSRAVEERLYLRSGRLWPARRLLENAWEKEQIASAQVSRSHRETSLLLSLILSYQGEQEEALYYAQKGGERGESLQSPYILAAALNRQGQAYLVRKDAHGYERATQCFVDSIRLCDEVDIPRRKVEALIGLCQVHGFVGDVQKAMEIGEEAITLADQVGDEWVAGWAHLMIGASFALIKDYGNSNIWLDSAYTVFDECHDNHGLAVTLMWRCYVWFIDNKQALAARAAIQFLDLVRDYQYEFLFKQKTLFGPPEPRILFPFLLAVHNGTLAERHAQVQSVMPTASRILTELNLDKLESHPGYQLRIQTLGPFRVWRGREEIFASDWKRQKARQLFQLLVTYRQSLLEREQIIDLLWPELDPEGGQRDFKISYATLCKVLEPKRGRKAPSAYVIRDSSRYGLRPDADIWLDAHQFVAASQAGDKSFADKAWSAATEAYQQALSLYEGDFLQEYPYEEWSQEERERLHTIYLRMAERLAQSLAKLSDWASVIAVCEQILSKDNCWEEAYRLLMIAYTQQGQRPLALRIYLQCVTQLADELAVDPALTTRQLHEAILRGDSEIYEA